MTNWCKIGIYLVLNQKKSKKYLVQNQNNFVPASKDLVSFWCRNKINLVQNQIQLPKSFGAEKNCFGAGKKPSWCEKKIILVQKREKPAGPVWCRKKIFWCRNRSLPAQLPSLVSTGHSECKFNFDFWIFLPSSIQIHINLTCH